MEIVVTHLTRMAKGFCCAAGIELATGKLIRALQRPYSGMDSRLTTAYLWSQGGPFKIGNVVDLGITTPFPNPPESEDHFFNPANAKVVSAYSPIQLWSLLRTQAKNSLVEIFGINPSRRRVSLFIPKSAGTHSLGFLSMHKRGKLSISKGLNESKIRFECFIDEKWTNLSVTCVNLYEDDFVTPDEAKVTAMAEAIDKYARSGRVIIGLGLTRPFAEYEGGDAVHWVQITGIHIRT